MPFKKLTEEARIRLTLAAIIAGVCAINALGLHFVFRAYCEEKAHAEFLYSCTHNERPTVCENNWLAYEAERDR